MITEFIKVFMGMMRKHFQNVTTFGYDKNRSEDPEV